MKTIKLSKYEQNIEKSSHLLRPASRATKQRVQKILENAKKNRSISLRISSFDLQLLKTRAAQNGMPYQTLISSVLHKFISNQLLEKDEVIKTVKMLQE